jgi:two-component system, LuxR family, response regulator TtrR
MNTKSIPLNIYVVDDDEGVRRSLGMLLLSRGYAVQIFESGEAFLAASQLHYNGCVILDLRMDGMNGLEVLGEMRLRLSTLVVIFLSGHGDIPAAVNALQNGAFGWLEKPCNDDVLLEKIQRALEHATQLAIRKIQKDEADVLWRKLTPREKEVARLVADGKTNKAIARLLGSIDPRTVETHRAKAFAKLGFANSNELDRFLHHHNL